MPPVKTSAGGFAGHKNGFTFKQELQAAEVGLSKADGIRAIRHFRMCLFGLWLYVGKDWSQNAWLLKVAECKLDGCYKLLLIMLNKLPLRDTAHGGGQEERVCCGVQVPKGSWVGLP